MKSIKKYTSILSAIVVFLIVGTFTIFSSAVITSYMSLTTAIEVLAVLFLIFVTMTAIFHKSKKRHNVKHAVSLALATISVFTIVGLLQLFLFNYFTSRMGQLLFAIIFFIIITILIAIGDITMSKTIEKAF